MEFSLTALMASCAPLVHPGTLQALVTVESHRQPYAISINYPEREALHGREVPELDRQPRTRTEAVQWVRALEQQGYSVSVGLAQINAERLTWLREQGIAGRVDDLLDPCTNLKASQAILLECFGQSAAAMGRRRLAQTLSCYNTGHPTLGIQNGYVARIARAAAATHQP